ncbi:hypothetical protein E2C01_033796 [Portunus trituberculatus]|uniref:Uncharacterized protein n=1 Tax=Portunus trituberculatus TaxID=210409 RepID=A0A5B7EYU6_PORTR|nr:hypothetical protein [Portunus trituberculatus]
MEKGPPLELVDTHLSEYSYIGGHLPTQADRAVLNAVCVPNDRSNTFPNLRRWAAHMESFTRSEMQAFPPHTESCKVCSPLCFPPQCFSTTILQFQGFALLCTITGMPLRCCGILCT